MMNQDYTCTRECIFLEENRNYFCNARNPPIEIPQSEVKFKCTTGRFLNCPYYDRVKAKLEAGKRVREN